MATYNSPQYTSNQPFPGPAGLNGARWFYYYVDLPANPTTADVLNFGFVPAGSRVLAGKLKSADLDTNGSPTITINIGDAGSANRLFAASTVGQVGTTADLTAATGLLYQYTSKTLITGALAANPATGAAGRLELMLLIGEEGLPS